MERGDHMLKTHETKERSALDLAEAVMEQEIIAEDLEPGGLAERDFRARVQLFGISGAQPPVSELDLIHDDNALEEWRNGGCDPDTWIAGR